MTTNVDPVSGRPYTIDPATGASRWADEPTPFPATLANGAGHARPAGAKRRGPLIAASATGVVGLLLGVGIGASGTSGTPAAGPTVTVTRTANATTAASAKASTSTAPVKPVSKAAATKYATLTSRRWKLLAKDPDAHTGERYIVYGSVTQFDSATGTEGFRADVDGVRRAESYEYDTNTILSGDAAVLASVVEKDTFEAWVTRWLGRRSTTRVWVGRRPRHGCAWIGSRSSGPRRRPEPVRWRDERRHEQPPDHPGVSPCPRSCSARHALRSATSDSITVSRSPSVGGGPSGSESAT
jgi:hypothetical protein